MNLTKRHWASNTTFARTAGSCAVALSAILVVAGCSSSSKSSTTPPTTASAGATGASSASGTSSATGSPISVGVISSDSGAGGTTKDATETISRWVNYTNANGGINGHPIDMHEMDDKTNPITNLQAAQTLIKQDKVVAILDNSFVGDAMAKYVDGAKVPVLGMAGGHNSHSYETDPNFFSPLSTPPTGTAFQVGKEIALSGAKKAAILYCAEVAACAGVPGQVKQYSASLGFSVVYTAGFTASQPNYTAVCLAAKSAGADGLFTIGLSPTADYRVYSDCASQGYRPAVSAASVTLGKEIYSPSSKVFPVTIGFGTLPATIRVAGNAVFHQVMDSYLPSAQSTAGVGEVWAGLEMFKATLKNAGANPTSQDVYNGLYAFQGETLGGFVAPMTFTKGSPTIVACTFSTTVNKGVVTTPDGTAAICKSK